MRMELDFYEFCKQRLFKQWNKLNSSVVLPLSWCGTFIEDDHNLLFNKNFEFSYLIFVDTEEQ